ncbi:MAG: lipid-A-disaccharide synthase [Alphaproteobacteria bacterium]
MKKKLKIFLIAGEPSGDFLGAQLMKALKRRSKQDLQFHGVGGAQMAAEGLETLIPLSALSAMGIVEIVTKIPKLLGYINTVYKTIKHTKPDVVVTIDFPGFNFRLGQKIKPLGIPLVHFVAPTVWAWKQWRAEKISHFVTHLLTLFQFEPPYFEKYGLPTTCVGHPLVEIGLDQGEGAKFRDKYHIPEKSPVLLFLPGSRSSELYHHVPVFLKTAEILAQKLPDLRIVVPTLPDLSDYLQNIWNTSAETIFIIDQEDKKNAYAASSLALAASGTVTLELALANVPTVMTYKVSKLTEWIARRFIKIKYACMINILLDEAVIPELLQQDCNADTLSKEILKLLNSKGKRDLQKEAFAKIKKLLHPHKESPSTCAAEVIAKFL